MKHLILSIVILLVANFSFCQTEIKLEDALKHINDSVKVCGKVAGIRFLENSEGQPTFINMGAAYPKQLLTVVIWGIVRSKFEKKPEELFMDKEVCVIGKIEIYKEKPQIVIAEPNRIMVK
jgi:hypothetical protein